MTDRIDTAKARTLARALHGEFLGQQSLLWNLATRAERTIDQMADEIDALRDDQEGLVDQHVLIKIQDRANRLARLIERAPHSEFCCTRNDVQPCNCWKSQA